MSDIYEFDESCQCPRIDQYSGPLYILIEAIGSDGCGYFKPYENGTFMIHPYCSCEKDGCPWCDYDAPNFKHRKSGLSLWWYKYPLRGAYFNMEKPSPLEWNDIIQECIKSIKEQS